MQQRSFSGGDTQKGKSPVRPQLRCQAGKMAQAVDIRCAQLRVTSEQELTTGFVVRSLYVYEQGECTAALLCAQVPDSSVGRDGKGDWNMLATAQLEVIICCQQTGANGAADM